MRHNHNNLSVLQKCGLLNFSVMPCCVVPFVVTFMPHSFSSIIIIMPLSQSIPEVLFVYGYMKSLNPTGYKRSGKECQKISKAGIHSFGNQSPETW